MELKVCDADQRPFLEHPLLPFSHLELFEHSGDGTPFAGGELTARVKNDFLTNPVSLKDLPFLNELINEFSKLPCFQRLFELHQGPSIQFTSLGRDHEGKAKKGFYDQNRGEHSRDVAHMALAWSLKHGATGEQTVVGIMTALCHDLGHSGFCHSGEEVLHSRGFHSFNHDLYTGIIASQNEVREFCLGYGISHKALLACLVGPDMLETSSRLKFEKLQRDLEERELPCSSGLDIESAADAALIRKWTPYHVLVQDVLDILAYETRDWSHSEASPHKKDKVKQIVGQVVNALEINEQGELSLTGPDSFLVFTRLLGVMSDRYQERACSPKAAVSNEVLFRIPQRAGLSDADYITGTDQRIIDMLPPEDRVLLHRGTDRYFDPLFAVLPVLRSRHGLASLAFPDSRELVDFKNSLYAEIEALQQQGQLPTDRDIFAAISPPLKKRFKLHLGGPALEHAKRLVSGADSGTVVLNKYPDDLFTITLRLEQDPKRLENNGSPYYSGILEVKARQTLVMAMQQGPIPLAPATSVRIVRTLGDLTQRILNETELNGHLEIGPVPPDRFGKGKERFEARDGSPA